MFIQTTHREKRERQKGDTEKHQSKKRPETKRNERKRAHSRPIHMQRTCVVNDHRSSPQFMCVNMCATTDV